MYGKVDTFTSMSEWVKLLKCVFQHCFNTVVDKVWLFYI